MKLYNSAQYVEFVAHGNDKDLDLSIQLLQSINPDTYTMGAPAVNSIVRSLEHVFSKPIEAVKFQHNNITKRLTDALVNIRKSPVNKFIASGPSYLSLTSRQIASPEHCKVTLLDYVECLVEAQRAIHGTIHADLNLMKRTISGLVSKPEDLTKISKDFCDVISDGADAQKLINSVMDIKRSKTNARYGDLVKRNNDWVGVMNGIATLIEQQKKVNLKHISRDVSMLEDYGKDLMDALEDVRISNSNAKALSTAYFRLGSQVRTYGLISSLIIELAELSNVYNDLMVSLTK